MQAGVSSEISDLFSVGYLIAHLLNEYWPSIVLYCFVCLLTAHINNVMDNHTLLGSSDIKSSKEKVALK